MLIDEMFSYYRQFRAYLHLSVFSDYEISQTDNSFLQFIADRNDFITAFLRSPDWDAFMEKFSLMVIGEDYADSLWLIRDFKLATNLSSKLTEIVSSLMPIFRTQMTKLDQQADIEDPSAYGALFACSATCHRVAVKKKVRVDFNRILYENLNRIVPIFLADSRTSVSLSCLTSLFQLATFYPKFLQGAIGFSNQSTSPLHRFLLACTRYSSCVNVAMTFLISVRPFMDEPSIAWHTAVMFHFIISESIRPKIRQEILVSLLRGLLPIVVNRASSTTEHLGTFTTLVGFCITSSLKNIWMPRSWSQFRSQNTFCRQLPKAASRTWISRGWRCLRFRS
jgi:hypothetical protein